MVLPDVNVLVAAYRDDAPDHAVCRSWFVDRLDGDESYALSDLVLSGFLRIVTHPRVFALPSPLNEDLAAIAIEAGREWITYDRDFARFEGLRWSTPGS